MTVKDLEVMYDYGNWANKKLFEVLSQLDTEQFTKSIAGGYGTVRDTMVHILSAQWAWLDHCGGRARGAALNAADYPTLASVMNRWEQVESYVREFLSTLSDSDLHRPVEFSIGGGPKQTMPLGELLHHAFIHGIHQRGQVALLVRSLGITPGNFDILVYYGNRFGLSA